MQRYIYGNLHHAGYQAVSSEETNFFMNYADALAPLMFYDAASKRGNLPQGAYKCFWMLTTDLGVIGGKKYLFLQESGMDSHRGTAVVQGYRSDLEDGDLYGPKFLEVLSTTFVPSKDALEVGEHEKLQAVHVDGLPQKYIEPAKLHQELLEGILLALLQKKRVIIRIPATGAEAMEESRRYLKAIYQRLPYEARQNNGCLTGATAPMLDISKAFTIILMDGDTDITGIESDAYQTVFDLSNEKGKKIPKEKDGKPYFFVSLIEFLTTQTPENLDNFFVFCQSCLEGDVEAGYPGINKYCALLDVYAIDQKKLYGEEIRKWAVNLHDSPWTEQMRESIHQKIAAAMSTEDLIEYLKAVLPRYEDLARLGFMCPADRDKEKDAARDQNAALTLRMMLRLPGYDLGAVGRGLAEHFVLKAREQYPCLTEKTPTAATLEALKSVNLPEKQVNANPWVNQLKDDVRGKLERLIVWTENTYAEQYKRQKTAGEEQIKAWPAEKSGYDLEKLYQELKLHYLHEELIAGWNRFVAQRIVAVCLSFDNPRELIGYTNLLEKEQEFRDCFHAHGGSFMPEQDSLLRGITTKWNYILDLCNRKCISAEELECWIQEVDGAGMLQDLAREQKQKKTRELLLVIPDGLTLEETKQRLKSCIRHGDLLDEKVIQFNPWGTKGEAKQLLDQIEKLQQYKFDRKQGRRPRLDNAKLCTWIVEQMPENKDLMMLLILQKPQKGNALVKILAQKSADITATDLKELYLSGCSRKCLCEDVGKNTSVSWRKAMDEFLPALPELPEPLKAQRPRKRTGERVLLLIEQILLGMAAVIPVAIMLIMGIGTVVCYGLMAVGLAILAAGFVGAANMSKSKQGKRFLFGLGIALVPGILVTIAALILRLI